MSIETPKNAPNEIASADERKEQELSEDEQQSNHENVCRERFIKDWVTASELTPEQKTSVSKYVMETHGAWREYNGSDFKVVEARVEGNVWRMSFGVFFDDYEAQRIDVEIPLSV
ncbi:MAG: hypothetical protein V1745_04785 [Patescibacteria group bacterium]